MFKLPGPSSWLNRRLAWRLCLLFVAGALVPVALSDWLVISVVGDLAERLNHERRADAARIASRQVLERLEIGETLLRSLVAPASADGRAAASSPVLRPAGAFDRVGCWRADGESVPGLAGDDPSLLAVWREATARIPARADFHVQLATSDTDPNRVLMGALSARGGTCVAMLSADYLWAPLRHGADDASWVVRDATGRVLASVRGDDADDVEREGRVRDDYTARLFMAREFASPDWTFVQSAPRVRVDWHRQPLVAWLVAVASATLLAVGLFVQWRIRRTLRPLEQLTAGAHRLARGEADARVDVRREDEVGTLAGAFNEMAGELQARERLLAHRAAHDDLTGLGNRYGLHQGLSQCLAQRAPGRGPAVVFIDLDRFKEVNDRHGHAVGDAVLGLAADRLRSVVGAGDVLARKGGDEFVIVLPDADSAAAVELAGRVVDALAEPFRLASVEHVCGASVGVAVCPEHGEAIEELLRCADIALYESKNAGRGRCTLFDPAQDLALRERADLLAALRAAVQRDEFVVHYQPRLDAASAAVAGAEALVRWQRPGIGLQQPGSFIELAEDAGLIGAIGLRVLDTALAQVARWERDGLRLPRVSVNVSPRQLDAGDLVEHVQSALRRHGLEASRLELEVTERLLGGDLDRVRAQLQQLREMGVAIAMDDFGTGYSSMAQLQVLPIDVMKIDRTFVRDLETEASAIAIARAIVALGKSLSLTLVAEGIETEGQAELLRAMACDEFQGFLYGRPMPAASFASMLASSRSIA